MGDVKLGSTTDSIGYTRHFGKPPRSVGRVDHGRRGHDRNARKRPIGMQAMTLVGTAEEAQR